MSTSIFAILLALFGAIWWLIHFRPTTAARHPKLPPGPRGLPIIGHLHMLGTLPHRTLYKLSQKYGPIMYLRFGYRPAIIVSSPAAAELFLKTHDAVFASRPQNQVGQILSYGGKSFAGAEYGVYWRKVRQFCTMELLSPAKIDSMGGMRKEELGLLVEWLKGAAAVREVVDVSDKVARLVEDMTFRMLFGKSRDKRFDLTGIIHEVGEISGAFNVADYVPFLAPFDLQGLTRRFKTTSKAIDKIFEMIIDEHEQDASNNGYKKSDGDFVDAILSLKNNPSSGYEQLSSLISRSNIKAIILDMIFAATDTSQISIEWIMSELMRHRRVMKLVQEEVSNIVRDSEIVEESHLSKMEYLDMVVKETMRLYPVGPLMIPHKSMEDIVVDGYYIPKNSSIFVNVWGIGRSSEVWSDNVNEFLPERFVDKKIDIRGQNFELLPFGSGRRGCPGIHLGLINIKLVVAQLVHSFNWELPYGMSPDELNMDETFGLSMPRAKHLLAIPSLRI